MSFDLFPLLHRLHGCAFASTDQTVPKLMAINTFFFFSSSLVP